MSEPLDQQHLTDPREIEQAALSSALSAHYIVMGLYALGGVLALMQLFAAFVSGSVAKLDVTLAILPPFLFALHLLAVRGLQRNSAWGYSASKGLGYFLLLLFPFGTVMGVILLAQLRKFSFSQ